MEEWRIVQNQRSSGRSFWERARKAYRYGPNLLLAAVGRRDDRNAAVSTVMWSLPGESTALANGARRNPTERQIDSASEALLHSVSAHSVRNFKRQSACLFHQGIELVRAISIDVAFNGIEWYAAACDVR